MNYQVSDGYIRANLLNNIIFIFQKQYGDSRIASGDHHRSADHLRHQVHHPQCLDTVSFKKLLMPTSSTIFLYCLLEDKTPIHGQAILKKNAPLMLHNHRYELASLFNLMEIGDR